MAGAPRRAHHGANSIGGGINFVTKTGHDSAVVTDDANGQSFYPGDGRGFYGGLQWRW